MSFLQVYVWCGLIVTISLTWCSVRYEIKNGRTSTKNILSEAFKSIAFAWGWPIIIPLSLGEIYLNTRKKLKI